MAMPVLRAPTIAARIQTMVPSGGIPSAAKNIASSAKGKAKTVCSNLIMSRSSRSLCSGDGGPMGASGAFAGGRGAARGAMEAGS